MHVVRSSYLALAFVLGAFFAAGADASAQLVYPRGLESADVTSGLFPGSNAGECCWMGGHADFRAPVPSGADELLLKIYVPAYASPQTLRVQVGAGLPITDCCVRAGEHDLVFALPPQSRQGMVSLKVVAAHTFVPAKLGLNPDVRELSVMLREVAFRDSSTGELLERSPLEWASSRAHIPILIVCGIAALLLTLRRPLFGVLAMIATDPFVFAFTYHGKMIALPKVVLIAVAIGLAPRLWRSLGERPGRSFYLLAGAQLFFLLSMVPGSLFHSHANATSAIVTAAEYLATFIIAYVAYRMDPDERAIRIALAALATVVALCGLAQPWYGSAETEVFFGRTLARAAGQLEGPNQLAGFLVVVVPAVLAFVVLRRGLLIEYVALGTGAVAALLTFSRAGVGALVFSCVVLFAIALFPARRRWIGAGAAALFVTTLTVAFGVFTGTLGGAIAKLFGSTSGGLNGGLGSRLDLWHGAFALWRSSPIFGVGAGNFEIQIGELFPGVRTHANSMFFQVLAEQGVFGFIGLIGVIASSIGAFVRRLSEPLALAACMASVGLAFHNIADCMWLFPKVGVIWWVLLAAGAASVDRE